jgi:hypothetical protein
MSHTTDWRCRSCRAVLGLVRDGVLRPVVPVESVDARGVARLPCLACGRVRIWAPSRTSSFRSWPNVSLDDIAKPVLDGAD